MTTTSAQPRVRADQLPDRALRIAAMLLERRPVKPHPRVKPSVEQMTVALARAVAVTPAGTEHGRLLARTFTPRAKGEGPRPADETAVLRLVATGQVPTPAGVANEMAARVTREARVARQLAAARQRQQAAQARVDELGPRAAAWVRNYRWTTRGSGPTWRELARGLGLDRTHDHHEQHAQVWALLAAGWLAAGRKPRSLNVGPRAAEEGARS